MSAILLDTSAYSNFIRGDERMHVELSKAIIVYFSVVVIGELLVGFKGGNREKENRSDLINLLEQSFIHELPVTVETAEHYSSIKHALKLQGTPIPSNDIWIAAHCLEVDATLVTYDRHFDQITGLKVHKI